MIPPPRRWLDRKPGDNLAWWWQWRSHMEANAKYAAVRADFKERLRQGRYHQALVVADLVRRGHGIASVPPQVLERGHTDEDIRAIVHGQPCWLEVKSRKGAFYGAKSFIYWREDPLLFSAEAWDAKRAKPDAVVICSQDNPGCFVVVPDTQYYRLYRKTVVDNVRGREYVAMVAPRISLLDWDQWLEEWRPRDRQENLLTWD